MISVSKKFENKSIFTLGIGCVCDSVGRGGGGEKVWLVHKKLSYLCKLNDCDLFFQAHNAKQLSRWCLHFIATNFSVFESTEEFDLVQGDNRDYVTEHRWPPLSYLKAQEEFEKKVKSSKFNSSKFNSSKCNIM